MLVNDFSIRSFRDTADRDYVNARLAYRARLVPQFLWSSLHCLEKYAKCILLLNRIDSRKIRHEITGSLARLARDCKFQIDLTEVTTQFIKRLETGAEFRYFEVSYYNQELDVMRLDRTVWELRRYCQPLDYDINVNGELKNLLQANLDHIRAKLAANSKDTCISHGWLESVIDNRKHAARQPLLWNNLFFGPSRRKRMKLIPNLESGNAPLYLHPEILDEVLKYVFLPPRLVRAYRQHERSERERRAGR